ncbi:MAG TPA: hypothetical protein ENG63_08260 [Candidatus Desulfofervidus auxilii]|uniref:Uncharacterized protein n=1 Tax=Desulfofervidus auxilii TaxID=1621989 RepID=A0A7C0U3T0_DESA2|nr:hypothetical protein [Candidatus Desulfofervidus auxilii]
MPFVSQAQRRFMYAVHPKLAREFEKKTPKGKKLPEYVDNRKKKNRKTIRKQAYLVYLSKTNP